MLPSKLEAAMMRATLKRVRARWVEDRSEGGRGSETAALQGRNARTQGGLLV